MTTLHAEVFIRAAERHGEDTEEGVEMALGDLQIYLEAAFSVMTPEQKTAFLLHPEVASCLASTLGEDVEVLGMEKAQALYERVEEAISPEAATTPRR